ncbi:retrotransposable element [Pimephales promelas]|nr:retrotransposable element [Pimephales promelas]
MGYIALPPPAPFLALPGEPPIPWTRWLQSFETFILAVGLTDVSTARKKALLLHCLGAEGHRVLGTLESGATSDYDTAVELLTAHFTPTQSALLRRFLFRQRKQLPGESVQQYVANLRGLPSTCKFGALQDEMIRDQLIEHTNNAKVRETLLLEPDDLSLPRAITIALQIESAAACASALTKQQTITDYPAPSPMPTSILQPNQNDASAAADSSAVMLLRRPQRSRPRPQTPASRPCDNCGSSSHQSRAQSCPARGQTCRNCGKRNHFASVCRSAPAESPTIIHNVYSGPVSFKACSVRLNDVCIPLLLDTGATLPLSPPSASLCGYGDSKIDLVGSLQVTVGYGTKLVPSFTFHVARRGANLMGLDLFSALGFSLVDTKGAAILTVSTSWQQKWPSLFEGLGCLTAFAHQPLLNPAVTPVIQPLRRIPLAFRDGVSVELKLLLDSGIIEPVDASPWVSNLVVAQKKSGALRFHGSTVFSKLDLRQGYLQVPLHPSSRNLTAFVTHEASHDERLSRVFAALAEHKLTLNAEKCVFSSPSIEYVGFRLSADGVTPLQSNVDAILAIPEPSSAAQVASFLGMTGYYLKFLPHYSATTAPLRHLLRKDEPWIWSQACSEAVQALKVQLTTAPVLAHFDISSPTMVTCDASATAIGAVLSQTQQGVEKPIAFASRALNQTEQRYLVGEREALACIWACERWHLYLYGRAFTLRTDHQALTALLFTSGTGHRPLRLHRWSDRLRQYNFDLKFTPGRDNVVADLLSHTTPSHPVIHITTDTDRVERDIVQMLHAPLQANKAGVVLLERHLCGTRPWKWVLAMAHEGHLGIVKLKQRCRDRVWWPGIDKDIEALVKDCAACLLSGKTGHQAPPPLQPLAWPSQPWDHLQLDICGEMQGVPHHQRFLVVVYDLHSKWPELIATGSVTSLVIINFLDSLFSRWGLPNTITTDNGPQLISAEFTTYLKNKGIRHIRTAYYHPHAS